MFPGKRTKQYLTSLWKLWELLSVASHSVNRGTTNICQI